MSTTNAPRSLLVVEDEMLLAMLIEHVLCDAGYRVLKAARLPAALSLVDTERFDAALLDINLAGTQVFPLAEVLRARGIPFLFTSGYGDHGLPPAYFEHPMLEKPYGMEQLLLAVTTLLDGAASSPV